jgi:hypothetical protein
VQQATELPVKVAVVVLMEVRILIISPAVNWVEAVGHTEVAVVEVTADIIQVLPLTIKVVAVVVGLVL